MGMEQFILLGLTALIWELTSLFLLVCDTFTLSCYEVSMQITGNNKTHLYCVSFHNFYRIINNIFPGVHIERLAMKLDVSIQPIGKLRCMDVATCGRECFYCDWLDELYGISDYEE